MKRPILVTAVWGLVFYLAFFSGFALLHAYAQDELIDPHGCLIGAWVQHANATGASAPPLASLVCVEGFREAVPAAIPQAVAFGHTSRGPPLFAP